MAFYKSAIVVSFILSACAATSIKPSSKKIPDLFKIVAGKNMDYPYNSSAIQLKDGRVLVAYEHVHNPVALPIRSEIDSVFIEGDGSVQPGGFTLSEADEYFYNPHFVSFGGEVRLFYNAFYAKEGRATFEFRKIIGNGLGAINALKISDDLSGQMRPWIFPSLDEKSNLTITYEYKNLNEHPDKEIKRNHLKMASSVNGTDWSKSEDFGTGVMPRNESFKDGTKIFTRQNGLIDQMMVFFRIGKQDGSWSAELPVSEHKDVHDAFPLKRLDGGIDLYYIASDGGEKYTVYRRAVNQSEELGQEMALTNIQEGSFVQPRPTRLNDGHILMLMAKDVDTQKNYELWGKHLDGDALAQFNSPGACFDLLQRDGYEAVYKCQVDRKKKFKGTPENDIFNQYTAAILSFVGQGLDAKKVLDSSNAAGVPATQVDLNDFISVSAAKEISDIATDKNIILINEAHHVPETRWLTISLLQPLYDKGYRYLAVETLNENASEQFNKNGIPKRDTGFYSAEPAFALMLRKAKQIGFRLIPYEANPTCDAFREKPEGCQNLREAGQAQKIYDRIFQKDPAAKVLIHAGYGHIDKFGGGKDFNWKPMAKYLWDLTKIEPFSIDQTIFMEKGNALAENMNYRPIVKKYSVSEPTVLKTKTGDYFVLEKYKHHYDAQVILPPEVNMDGRPQWRALLPEVQSVHIKNYCSKKQRCLVQAILTAEAESPAFVPFDQAVTGIGKITLFLKPAKYKVRFIDLESLKIVSEQFLEVG